MDFSRAFNYPRNDPAWITKLLILAVVSIVPIVNFAAAGYSLQALRMVASGEDSTLPEWDRFGDYFMDGLRLLVVFFVIGIAAGILSGVVSIPASMVLGRAGGLISMAWTGLIGLLLAVIGPAIVIRVATAAGWGAGFDFAGITAIATRDTGLYMMAIVAAIVFSLFAYVGLIACGVGILITAPWGQLSAAHALGQVARAIGAGPEGQVVEGMM